MTELKDLVQPIGCYVATYTENGRTIEVQHICGNENCPEKG